MPHLRRFHYDSCKFFLGGSGIDAGFEKADLILFGLIIFDIKFTTYAKF